MRKNGPGTQKLKAPRICDSRRFCYENEETPSAVTNPPLIAHIYALQQPSRVAHRLHPKSERQSMAGKLRAHHRNQLSHCLYSVG